MNAGKAKSVYRSGDRCWKTKNWKPEGRCVLTIILGRKKKSRIKNIAKNNKRNTRHLTEKLHKHYDLPKNEARRDLSCIYTKISSKNFKLSYLPVIFKVTPYQPRIPATGVFAERAVLLSREAPPNITTPLGPLKWSDKTAKSVWGQKRPQKHTLKKNPQNPTNTRNPSDTQRKRFKLKKAARSEKRRGARRIWNRAICNPRSCSYFRKKGVSSACTAQACRGL